MSHHPISLQLFTSYINNHDITVEEYTFLLETYQLKLKQYKSKETRALLATLSITLHALKRKRDSVMELLYFLSLMCDGDIDLGRSSFNTSIEVSTKLCS